MAMKHEPLSTAHAGAVATAIASERITTEDLHLFSEGTHYRLFDIMGAHVETRGGIEGCYFAVWAPNASRVSVTGDFNGWNKQSDLLAPLGSAGIWAGFVAGASDGARYKYHVQSSYGEYAADKSDPFAFRGELAPQTDSLVCQLDYSWNDQEWIGQRPALNAAESPLRIYELHLGSWKSVPEEDNRQLTYCELAAALPEYLRDLGFTHVEFMPVTEHPFYGSWGYQTTGYFAPTSRYGTPQDFMFLVDCLHRHGIGVILDWVPAHFPNDEHGLAFFDGTHLYEHRDPRQGIHPDWDTVIFNLGRREVCGFLINSALFWLERYHVDGLRVDAVASMLYLDYSRSEGEWVANRYGGRENLESLVFLRQLNDAIAERHPGVLTIAEESTSWPMVTGATSTGGLGFAMKWDMGWMHDTLKYLGEDPIYRKYDHDKLTFRNTYAYSERFVLPLSHDEVVHGKGSLLEKMPGSDWEKFAGLRLLLGYMYAQPGKKFLFMGSEFGQRREWDHDGALDWDLLGLAAHRGIHRYVKELNALSQSEPALYELDFHPSGFAWIDCHDADKSIVCFLRRGKNAGDVLVVVCNFTPVPRTGYRIGVPEAGGYAEVLNSDASCYGGQNWGNYGAVASAPIPTHGLAFSLELTLPPLAMLVFKKSTPRIDANTEVNLVAAV